MNAIEFYKLDAIPTKAHKKQILAKLLPDEVNPTGIIETISEVNKIHKAEAIIVGPDVRFTKPGDKIRYTRNIINGLGFEIQGEKFVFLHEDKHCLFNE